jgi:AraC-like DNA-binding protein
LENNAYACVEGTVIFIDGRNIYIQDETAGIDLYLNANTVPSTLAIGDNVRAYGKHAVYNGLVELSGINGGNANAFAILSSGNELPLAVQTIEAINSDYSGDNLLQATRVKIENATIGAINTSGTTVISQDGNDLNIYRIPTVEGMMEGDLVTVTGIIGCYNAPQLRVVSADDIEFTHRPVLSVNPSTLTGFTYEFEDGGPSEIQYFEVSGDYLTHNVSVYPSESFEVSTQPVNMFRPENPAMIFIPGSGHFYDIKIYIRLKAGLEVGTYNEQIAIASEEADTIYVSVTGIVTGDAPTPPTPTEGEYVRISNLSSLTDGAYVIVAARFDENIDLEDLSRRHGMSYPLFRKLFKAQTGFSPHAYVLEMRLNRAKALLRETSLSVEEIGGAVGFSSLAYFSAAFQKCTGVSPSSFRVSKT